MIYILRNNQQYGPYTEQTLLSYVENGQILLQDRAIKDNNLEVKTVGCFLREARLSVHLKHQGNLLTQLKDIGAELIIPRSSFATKQWLSDKRLLTLALIGLVPSILMMFPLGDFLTFYSIALYFSGIWGLFFYYFFKTSQVSAKITLGIFFLTQLFVFLVWDLLGLAGLNPFYHIIGMNSIFNMLGYILGVGVTEELAKAISLFMICKRAKEPLIPQTMVYYGLMSGIAFGVFEGVQYQMGVNAELGYTESFFMNIARLTSLPFLHAVWCGIAGYFIAFANLYPKYRISLYFLAIAIPAVLHGLYDTFCGSLLGMFIALPITFIGVILLMTYLKQGVNYQSKLRN